MNIQIKSIKADLAAIQYISINDDNRDIINDKSTLQEDSFGNLALQDEKQFEAHDVKKKISQRNIRTYELFFAEAENFKKYEGALKMTPETTKLLILMINRQKILTISYTLFNLVVSTEYDFSSQF